MKDFNKWWSENFHTEYMKDGNWQKYELGDNEFGTSSKELDIMEFCENSEVMCEYVWYLKEKELKSQNEKIEKLKNALEFYGDASKWEDYSGDGSYFHVSPDKDLSMNYFNEGEHCAGKLARETLKEVFGE